MNDTTGGEADPETDAVETIYRRLPAINSGIEYVISQMSVSIEDLS